MGLIEDFRKLCRRHQFVLRHLHVLLILVAISFDPFFFYIPVINDDSNCVGLDKTLRLIVVVFRSFVDGVYVMMWLSQKGFQDFWVAKLNLKKLSSIVAILALLPLPQVVVYVVSWRQLTVVLIKFVVLIQFCPRVYLIIQTYIYGKNHIYEKKEMWFAAAFYLFMFLLASNFLGAFWYLRAIERNMDCWRTVCRTRDLCGASLYCNGSSSKNKYLDKFCPIPPAPNSTFFDYGIYLDAFEKDIVGIHTGFLHKFLFCFWWGLQSLSCLGQNLHPGTYIWDNFFGIFIVISGLVLFALLIGNMQSYLQKGTAPDTDSASTKQKEQGGVAEEKHDQKEQGGTNV